MLELQEKRKLMKAQPWPINGLRLRNDAHIFFCYAIYSVSDRTLLSPPERTQKHNSIKILSSEVPRRQQKVQPELEPGFLEDIISLSDSIKYGEEENLNEFEYKPKEEVEIIGFKSKSDLGKGKESAPERKEGHSTGIVPKSCSKQDRGKLPLSVS